MMEEGGSEGAGSSGTVTQRPPPPPSPLTGCYLLIVVGEPHSDRHKELILQQLAQGKFLDNILAFFLERGWGSPSMKKPLSITGREKTLFLFIQFFIR